MDMEADNVQASTGFLFEAVAHCILKRGGECQARRLGNLTEETVALPKFEQQSFSTVDEIKPTVKSRYKNPPWDHQEVSYNARFLITRYILP